MYGIAKQFNRLSDKEFVVKGDYVFVDHGFFRPMNIFWPLPLGVLIVGGHFLYAVGVFMVIYNKLWFSWIVNFWYGTWGGLSATGGVHRLWCHRSYDAKLPLRIFLMLGQTMTGQHSLYSWSVGHRVHHKYTDTDADPHNTKRGFFFAHLGWVYCKEHPDVSRKERLYDYSDLLADPVVKFQHEYYYWIYAVVCFILPISIQMILCGDTFINAFLLSYVMRNLSIYHDTAFVNSAAHMFGDRPYNHAIEPRENYYVSLAAFGEGYHNYHHNFPWDYKAGESTAGFNFTSLFIEGMAWLGLAFNLRTASDEIVTSSKAKVVAEVGRRDRDEVQGRTIVTWAAEVLKNRRIGEETCEFL